MTRRLSAARVAARDEFHRQLAIEPTNCAGRESEFADYDRTPTPQRATEMCEGCPLMDSLACPRFAGFEKPHWGVWGGQAWNGGRPVTASEPENELEAA